MHVNIATIENWDIPKGIKSRLPESLLLGIYAKQRDICDNHQDMPSGKMIKQWMDKDKVVYTPTVEYYLTIVVVWM